MCLSDMQPLKTIEEEYSMAREHVHDTVSKKDKKRKKTWRLYIKIVAH